MLDGSTRGFLRPITVGSYVERIFLLYELPAWYD